MTELPLGEPAGFNPGQLEILCEKLGEQRAEAELALALSRLANLLVQIGSLERGGDYLVLERSLAALVNDARLIGMATLAQAGRNVLDCLDSGDPIALAATMARLGRVGDRSLHAVWDLEDLSG